jgi:hypothetical protein
LSILLTAFDHHTSEDGTYVMPQKLIAAAIAEFEEKGKACLRTAENIRAAFGTGGGVS